MMYEVTSKRVGQDAKGNDREYVEKFLIDNCELCAEAESKCLEFWNGENDVISVKQSKVREFVNERVDDDQDIYLATIEDVFINEATGEKKATKYIVGLFAVSTECYVNSHRLYETRFKRPNIDIYTKNKHCRTFKIINYGKRSSN